MQLTDEIYEFARARRLAVIATNSPSGPPESALVGFAVSPSLELVFDTTGATRKAQNLRRDPRISVVIGCEGEETLQIEGVAEEPIGQELERVRNLYFTAYPDGRQRLSWQGITHFLVRPSWARFTSYVDPRKSGEHQFV